MAIIPSGGGYPGIIGEAELIAAAVATVVASKQTAEQAADAAVADATVVADKRVQVEADALAVGVARTQVDLDAPVIAAARAQADIDAPIIAAARAQADVDAPIIADARVQVEAAAAAVALNAATVEAAKNGALSSAAIASQAEADAVAAALAAGNADKLGKGDARVQALGGVSLRGDDGSGSGLGGTLVDPSLTEEFELVFQVRRTSSDATMRHLACIQTSGGHINLCFGASTSGGAPQLGFGDTYEVAVPNPTTWHWVSFGRDAAGWFYSLDGVVTRSTALTGQTPVAINRVFAGDSGVGQFGGDVARCWRFNFALSSAQRSSLILNEALAEMTTKGYSHSQSSTISNGALGTLPLLDVCTYSGGTLAMTTNTGVRYSGMSFVGDIPAGSRIRISGTDSSVTAGAALYFSTPMSAPLYVDNTSGSFRHEAVLANGATQLTIRYEVVVVGVNQAIISGFSVEILGAEGRWEPLNVTPLPRWIDLSGNGNDLIPATTNSGIMPLNPQSGLVRVIKGTVAGASVSSGSVGSIGTLTPTTAGLAAIRAGDALTASWGTVRPANAGGVSAYAPTDGAATLETAAHGAGVTISAGTAVNIIHHLN